MKHVSRETYFTILNEIVNIGLWNKGFIEKDGYIGQFLLFKKTSFIHIST